MTTLAEGHGVPHAYVTADGGTTLAHGHAYRTAASAKRWYHGSPNEIAPGTDLIPGLNSNKPDGEHDHVWISDDPHRAATYGDVYEIETDHQPKMTHAGAGEFYVPSARVVRKIGDPKNAPVDKKGRDQKIKFEVQKSPYGSSARVSATHYGREVGHVGWDGDGEIQGHWTHPDYSGEDTLLNQMIDHARKKGHSPRFAARTAARDDDLIGQLTFSHHRNVEGERDEIHAHHPDAGPSGDGRIPNWAGHIAWFPDGEIAGVAVSTAYQRRGVASELWSRAKELAPNLRHSDIQSSSGRAWAATTAAKKVRKTERPQKCKYCKAPAIKSLLWAEGMAYIPVCDEHESTGRHRIEVTNDDEVVGVHQIKATAAQRHPDIVSSYGTPFIDVAKYFPAGGVDKIDQAPWHKQMHYHTPEEWAEHPVEELPINSLHRTQSHYQTMRHPWSGSAPAPESLPQVVRHQGKDWLIDGHHRVVNDVDNGHDTVRAHVMDLDAQRPRTAAWTPSERIFGPTEGLDTRLFDGDRLKSDVRKYILETLSSFWGPRFGATWEKWARVYFAGSEASEWTSKTLVGNGDFDVLIGVDYEACRVALPTFAHMSDEEITSTLNADLRTLDDQTAQVMIPIDGELVGPFSNTWYVNAHSWDIRNIKPYAAYDVTNDVWAVKPPHLPGWSLADFPEGPALVAQARAYEKLVRAVLALPEPYRSQQGAALWDHLHGDRSRAFGPQGEGWYDPGNVIEKWLDQRGLWEKLVKIKMDTRAHPEMLNAPQNWSNDPHS